LIGLDTNVLIRYLVQDDRKQAALATSFIERYSSGCEVTITFDKKAARNSPFQLLK
jgi:predicted nucleic-acid-binding protein